MIGISEVAHVCDDYVTIYKHSAFRPLHRNNHIHQPKSIKQEGASSLRPKIELNVERNRRDRADRDT